MDHIGLEGTSVRYGETVYSDAFPAEEQEAVMSADLTHFHSSGGNVKVTLQSRTDTGSYTDTGEITMNSSGPASVRVTGIKPICRFRITMGVGVTGDFGHVAIGEIGWFKARACCDGCVGDGDCSEENVEALAAASSMLEFGSSMAMQATGFWLLAHMYDSIDREPGNVRPALKSRLKGVVAGVAGGI